MLEAGHLLAGSGVYGFVWLDPALRVVETFGRLAEFVRVGAPVVDSIIALVGLEDVIAELADGTAPFLDLPAVAIRETDAPETRLNLTFYWMTGSRQLLLLLSRALPRSNLEQQLTQQMRARLMAEADARALATRLEAANRDLEEFASIISHDLRAPMRQLRYLVEDARTQVPANQPAGLTDKLDKAAAAAQRMTAMLGALFEYSSAGYKASLVTPTDTRALLDAVIAHAPNADRFLISIDGVWPVMETVAAPLQLVLANLIENAMKYHDQPIGRIALAAADSRHHAVFTITDDGPGIPPAWKDIVFLPFRRLDETTPVEGSGMGLALVKRTLARIGGRVELISPVSGTRGTSFRVLWPKVIDAG